jgi:hypothetical protein
MGGEYRHGLAWSGPTRVRTRPSALRQARTPSKTYGLVRHERGVLQTRKSTTRHWRFAIWSLPRILLVSLIGLKPGLVLSLLRRSVCCNVFKNLISRNDYAPIPSFNGPSVCSMYVAVIPSEQQGHILTLDITTARRQSSRGNPNTKPSARRPVIRDSTAPGTHDRSLPGMK